MKHLVAFSSRANAYSFSQNFSEFLTNYCNGLLRLKASFEMFTCISQMVERPMNLSIKVIFKYETHIQ